MIIFFNLYTLRARQMTTMHYTNTRGTTLYKRTNIDNNVYTNTILERGTTLYKGQMTNVKHYTREGNHYCITYCHGVSIHVHSIRIKIP